MIDAWFSSSEHTRTSCPPNVVSTPRLAANPVVNSTTRSLSFHSAERGLQLRVDRARADDEPRRTRAGSPAVERIARGGDYRRVVREPEVVVRGERHDVLTVGEYAFRAMGVEVARSTPLSGVVDALRLVLGPVVPAHETSTSSSESTRTWTIWCSSADVIVSGGISTTTSPSGRSRTPRATAAAQTRRPHR